MDIKKVYIDSRFKTNGNSDSDFFIELPITLNVPDKTVCYIDEIVIPVSWTMISSRNNRLYFKFINGIVNSNIVLVLDSGNYNGISFSEALQSLMNSYLAPFAVRMQITYDNINNKISFLLIVERASKVGTLKIKILNDNELESLFSVTTINIKSINGVLMLKDSSEILPGVLFKTYLDMHTTRNLYLVSSALGNHETISNFGLDTVIKKIPIRYNYGEMLFDSAVAGFDFINISRRSLKRIDIKLVDVFGNVVSLNGNHFSFSLVFSQQG
jgi:hypothetical protein